MDSFLENWADAAYTSTGFFWMALWAFVLGYVISGFIQVFVSPKNLQKAMGGKGVKNISLGAFFGFISSSCSFSALATTKSLFQKGASFVSAMAFLLASTNLVIELGIVISIFLGWQFIVGEYLGGILLILLSWLIIRILRPEKLIEKARKQLGEAHSEETDTKNLKEKITHQENWIKVGKQYLMEWKMVWKDVTVGFTIAGIISAFVPDSFFQSLFINSGQNASYSFLELLEHVIIGPVAAFMTFIGSMGNIPLAALLFGKGVSFAGVMAFIFSDLVVFPVLRINAKYYGWKMSLFILFTLFSALIVTSLLLHYGMESFEVLPDPQNVLNLQQNHFQFNYTFFLNSLFLAISAVFIYLAKVKGRDIHYHKEMAPKSKKMEQALYILSMICYLWLAVGLGLKFLV